MAQTQWLGRCAKHPSLSTRLPSMLSLTPSQTTCPFQSLPNTSRRTLFSFHGAARTQALRTRSSLRLHDASPSTIRSRSFGHSAWLQHGHITPPRAGEERRVTFIDKEGREVALEVADGDNLLDIAQANDLEMEGACGGSCACSTCHVIVCDEDMYDKMEEPSDDENDMLDLAFGLTETSRLGCQVHMSKALDGLVVKLPSMTRNMQASDFADKEKKS